MEGYARDRTLEKGVVLIITIFVDDVDQLSLLEYMLIRANLDYTTEVNDGRYGLQSPYLLIDGVPLDLIRSYKWIFEQFSKNQ